MNENQKGREIFVFSLRGLICCLLIVVALINISPAYGLVAGESNCCCPDECTDNVIYLKDEPFVGDEIMEIQQALVQMGFYHGVVDGIYGPKTVEAVKLLQQVKGLSVNGQINSETRNMLKACFEIPVSTEQIEGPRGEVRLEIDIPTRTLTVYDDGKPFKSYKVGVGKHQTPTPIGEWEITRMAKNWGTGFGTRWMGLNVPWGMFGIHGTNKPWSIGTRASHGCVRMFNKDVEELYNWVKPGTKVKIIGKVYPERYEDRLVLRRGYKGSDVYYVQVKLKELGYLKGSVDGIYGQATIDAVKKFQKDHNFPVTGELDIDVYPAIGL